MEIRSCITDKPIEKNSDDKLKMSRYGNVLSNFIKASDTPLTVGLQGEWGTGKTSMLYMLLEHFKSENIATSWVNTWEYSMFRSPGETTPAILKGMLTNLKLSCESEGKWTIEEKSKDSVKKRIEGETGISYTEFAYHLMQGYEFYWLYQNKNCKLQMGGSDQWGNITTGTELIRKKSGGEAYAFTCPLITKTDGGKFGKTEKGNIWLDPEKTSPFQTDQRSSTW